MAKFMASFYLRNLLTVKNRQVFGNINTINTISSLKEKVKEKYLKLNIEDKDDPQTIRTVSQIIDPTVHRYFAKEDGPLKMVGVHGDIQGVSRIEGEREFSGRKPEIPQSIHIPTKIGTITQEGVFKGESETIKSSDTKEDESFDNQEFQQYVTSVRHVSVDSGSLAVMPALDSPYDEFPNFADVEEPYDTDDDEENTPPPIEEP